MNNEKPSINQNYPEYNYKLTPFKLFTLQNFPYIEADFDAITNYQLFCKVVEYLNEVIANENTVESIVQQQIDNINVLYNWFLELDVQEEINNKLDSMASDGTLSELLGPVIEPFLQTFNDRLDRQDAKIEAVESGSPLVASSTAGMTDTSRVYVNTTDGNWYYYNGTNWVIGGVYQATEDSNTVNILNNITKNINNLEFSKTNTNNITWYHGGLNTTTGANMENDAYVRSYFIFARAGSTINVNQGYKFSVCRYSSQNNSDFIDGKSATITGEYIVPSDSYLRIAIADENNTEQTDFSIISNFRLNILSEEQNNIIELTNMNFWEIGGIRNNNGEKNNSTNRIRLTTYISDYVEKFEVRDGYVGYIIAYDENNTYVGYWIGNGFAKNVDGLEITSTVDLNTIRNNYPNYKYIISLRTPASASINNLDVIYKKCIFYMNINSLFNTRKIEYVVDNYIKEPEYNVINNNVNSYFALWENFVTDGYGTKTLLNTINEKPMYLYTFSNNNKYVIDDNGTQKISDNENLYDKKNILIVSGLHGNEKGAPLYLYNLMTLLVYNKDFNDTFNKYNWYIIPIGNPTGYDDNTRNNFQNININRDFEEFITVEAQEIRDVLTARDYEYVFDLHQTWAGASSSDRPSIAGYVSLPYNENSDTVNKIFNNIMPSAMMCQSFLCDRLFINNLTQTFFPWDGTNNPTLRNYAKNYSTYSLCYETSRNCYYYSKSTEPYNSISLIVGNTFIINTILNLIK